LSLGFCLLAFVSWLLSLCPIGDTFSDFDFQFRPFFAIPAILAICFKAPRPWLRVLRSPTSQVLPYPDRARRESGRGRGSPLAWEQHFLQRRPGAADYLSGRAAA